MEPKVRLTVTQFEDASDRNANGTYDWYYSGWYYVVDLGDISFKARRYRDTPSEADFLSCREPATGKERPITKAMLDDPRFQAAARHLLNELELKTVKVLSSDGYEDVVMARETP